jgi:fumarate hydratase class II/high-affinity iron transporter
MRPLRLVVVIAFAFAAPAIAAEDGYWSKLAARIAAEITKAEALALAGKADEAKKAVTQIYFGLFESEKMEAALRKEVGSKHAFEREKQFGEMRKLAGKGAPAEEIRRLSAALRAGLAEDGRTLDAAKVSPDVFAVNQ